MQKIKEYENTYNLYKDKIEEINDFSILYKIVECSFYLSIYNRYNNEKAKIYLADCIKAKEKILEFIYDEDGELELAEYYILLASLDKENVNKELFEKAKKIYIRIYEQKQDEQVLEKLNELVELIKQIEGAN